MSSIDYSCTFCDDVRQEVQGKFSLIGVYLNDLSVTVRGENPEHAPSLSKFFIVCCLKNLDKRKKYEISIEQTEVDDKVYEVDKSVINSDEKSVLIFEMARFVIPSKGKLQVFLKSGKDKHLIDELKLKINKEKS